MATRNPPNPPGHLYAGLHTFTTNPSQLRVRDWLRRGPSRSQETHRPILLFTLHLTRAGRVMGTSYGDEYATALVHSGPTQVQLDHVLSHTPYYTLHHTQHVIDWHRMAKIEGQDFVSNIATSCMARARPALAGCGSRWAMIQLTRNRHPSGHRRGTSDPPGRSPTWVELMIDIDDWPAN